MTNLYVIKGKYDNQTWEDLDEAYDKDFARYLLKEYCLAYRGMNYQLKIITRRVPNPIVFSRTLMK